MGFFLIHQPVKILPGEGGHFKAFRWVNIFSLSNGLSGKLSEISSTSTSLHRLKSPLA
jgi:hypothetical protein